MKVGQKLEGRSSLIFVKPELGQTVCNTSIGKEFQNASFLIISYLPGVQAAHLYPSKAPSETNKHTNIGEQEKEGDGTYVT